MLIESLLGTMQAAAHGAVEHEAEHGRTRWTARLQKHMCKMERAEMSSKVVDQWAVPRSCPNRRKPVSDDLQRQFEENGLRGAAASVLWLLRDVSCLLLAAWMAQAVHLSRRCPTRTCCWISAMAST